MLVRPLGLEPRRFRLWGGCSNRLSYGHIVAFLTIFIVTYCRFLVSNFFQSTHLREVRFLFYHIDKTMSELQSARSLRNTKQTRMPANLTKKLLVPLGFSQHVNLHFILHCGLDESTSAILLLSLVYLKTEILSWLFLKKQRKQKPSELPKESERPCEHQRLTWCLHLCRQMPNVWFYFLSRKRCLGRKWSVAGRAPRYLVGDYVAIGARQAANPTFTATVPFLF